MKAENVGYGLSQNNVIEDEKGFKESASLAQWLRQECGYDKPEEGFENMVGKEKSGRRPWIEVPHAKTGETHVFWCSESSNHDFGTVMERGLNLRLVLKKLRSSEGYGWFTANEGTDIRTVSFRKGATMASNPTEMPATSPAEDVF